MRWPLAAANARAAWSERESALLVLEHRGLRGLGECAPLHGYSSDPLDAAVAALEGAISSMEWADAIVAQPGPEATRALLIRAGQRAGTAAARFALESALLDLRGRILGVPVWALLRSLLALPSSPAAVPLSALARAREPGAIEDEVRDALARGLRVVKLKIGGAPLADDLRRAEAAVRAGAVLRLDANQAMGAEALRAASASLAALEPELLEEPVRTEEWDRLEAGALPLAMDESLQAPGAEIRVRRAARAGAVAALVLKPMALGGIARCLELAEVASGAGLRLVVTHLFDGPVATAAAAELALALSEAMLPCGLDLHGRTEHWPAARIARVQVASITASDEPGLGVSLPSV
jgi:L-alanine-DL-glutamate epimerase-like enolase superfamily enzyme